MRTAILTAIFLAVLTACASTPDTRALLRESAPRVSEFRFDLGPPLSAAGDFEPWALLTAGNQAESPALERCIAAREACENAWLLRYRRLLELAQDLERDEQVRLVQEYFNSVEQTLDAMSTSSRAIS